jgi:Ca2+-binding RTX toxin-like protein
VLAFKGRLYRCGEWGDPENQSSNFKGNLQMAILSSGTDTLPMTSPTNSLQLLRMMKVIDQDQFDQKLYASSGGDHSLGTAGDDFLMALFPTLAPMTLFGGDGNDTIGGSYGNDVVIGGRGADQMYGGEGADTLCGGVGDDRLDGGAGNDTYLFNRACGTDTISDVQGTDTLIFGAGIQRADLAFTRSLNNLVIEVKDPSNALLADKVVIENWYASATLGTHIESIKLADGSSIEHPQLELIGQIASTTYGI